MFPTTIIPKVVKPRGDEQRYAELVVERGELVQRIARAWRCVAMSTTHSDIMHWRSIVDSLHIDLELIDASLKLWRTPKDERYAEVRAQMRHEDQNCVGASNGAVDWENS